MSRNANATFNYIFFQKKNNNKRGFSFMLFLPRKKNSYWIFVITVTGEINELFVFKHHTQPDVNPSPINYFHVISFLKLFFNYDNNVTAPFSLGATVQKGRRGGFNIFPLSGIFDENDDEKDQRMFSVNDVTGVHQKHCVFLGDVFFPRRKKITA